MAYNEINVYPRRMFFILSISFIFILYVIRGYTLNTNPLSYQFIANGFNVNWRYIDFVSLILFLALYLSLSLIFPKKDVISWTLTDKKNIRNIFIFQNMMLLLAIVFFGARMGTESNVFNRLILSIALILPILYTALGFFIVNSKSIKKICIGSILFILPTILLASKSGILQILMLLFGMSLLLGKKIINFKNSIIFICIIIIYPYVSIFAYYLRGEQTQYFLEFFLSHANNDQSFLYTSIESISRRISGYDILMIPAHSPLINISNFFEYLFKGIFSAGFIDALLSHEQSYGIGRYFAINLLNVPSSTVIGIEPTLYGIAHFSDFPALYAILINVVAMFTLLIIRYFAKYSFLFKVFFYYQAINFPIILITGTYLQITLQLRYLIFLTIIVGFFNFIKRNKNENSNYF